MKNLVAIWRNLPQWAQTAICISAGGLLLSVALLFVVAENRAYYAGLPAPYYRDLPPVTMVMVVRALIVGQVYVFGLSAAFGACAAALYGVIAGIASLWRRIRPKVVA